MWLCECLQVSECVWLTSEIVLGPSIVEDCYECICKLCVCVLCEYTWSIFEVMLESSTVGAVVSVCVYVNVRECVWHCVGLKGTLCFHGNVAVCKLSPKRTGTGPQILRPSGDPDTGPRQGDSANGAPVLS